MSLFNRIFRNVSIRWKMVAILLGVAAFSLLLAGAGMLWNTRVAFEREVDRKLALLADVIGTNSTAALAFRDARAANETLAALRGDPYVVAGGLYDVDGRLFARYQRDGATIEAPLSVPVSATSTFGDDEASVVRPIALKGRPIGTAYIVADTGEWNDTLWKFVGLLGVLFAIVLTVGLLVSLWLQPLITQPITELAEVMRRVGRARMPNFRAEKRGNDEIGALVDGFNDMLTELGKQRNEIERTQQELRQRVTELDAEVAERRRAETELRYTSDQLKNFIEFANIGLHWAAPDGTILWANRHELDMLGYSADEYIGHAIADFYVDRGGDDIFARLNAGETVDNFEARMRHKDGTLRDVLISANVYWENNQFVHTRCFTRDITERKRAQEQFRLAVEAAPTGMVMVDQEYRIVLANRQVEELFGYAREELLGRSIGRLVPQSLFVDAAILPVGTGREIPSQHRDGQPLLLEIGLNPFRTSEGRFCLASITDIAERKRAQDALRLSEERYRTLVAATASVVFVSDDAGRVLEPNPAWEVYTGQPPADYLERGWIGMLHVEDRSRAQAESERALHQGAAYDMEARVWHARSQTHRYCVIRAIPLRNADGSVREWIGAMTDIDDRKRADERLRLAVEAAPNAMLMIDQRSRIVLANRQLEVLFGYTRAELLGRSVELLLPRRGGRQADLGDEFFANPQARLMGADRELHGRHKDGRHVLVELGLNPFTTADGVFCLASIIDITERKRAEQELRRFTDELQRSNRELAQFAYVASHDLQEPLRAISGCVQLLQQRYRSKLDERADDLIQHAVSGAIRMQALINDLLSYSRVGTRAKPFEACDLGQSLQEALANLSVSIKEAGAEVTWDDMPVIDADPTQFTQLFQNLISNALKFRGGERVPHIHVGIERKGGGQMVYVRDNGIGIEPQYFDRIFGVFQRLHSRNKYPGNGIGLAICRKIVERHGGRMWLESAPGEGSTFYFTIPDGGGQNEQSQPERHEQQQYH